MRQFGTRICWAGHAATAALLLTCGCRPTTSFRAGALAPARQLRSVFRFRASDTGPDLTWLSSHQFIYDTYGSGLTLADTLNGQSRVFLDERVIGTRDVEATHFGAYPLELPGAAHGARTAILCVIASPNSSKETVLVISASGGVLGRRSCQGDVFAYPAGSGWLGFEAAPLAGPGRRRRAYVADSRCRVTPIRSSLSERDEWVLQPEPSTPTGGVCLAAVTAGWRSRSATVSPLMLANGVLVSRGVRWSAHLPTGYDGLLDAISPDGRTLAILAQRKLPRAAGSRSRPEEGPPTELTLWLAQAGSPAAVMAGGFRCAVGYAGFPRPFFNPGNLEWLPDGSAVSFTAQRQLWEYSLGVNDASRRANVGPK